MRFLRDSLPRRRRNAEDEMRPSSDGDHHSHVVDPVGLDQPPVDDLVLTEQRVDVAVTGVGGRAVEDQVLPIAMRGSTRPSTAKAERRQRLAGYRRGSARARSLRGVLQWASGDEHGLPDATGMNG
jgi:hypothetical protein